MVGRIPGFPHPTYLFLGMLYFFRNSSLSLTPFLYANVPIKAAAIGINAIHDVLLERRDEAVPEERLDVENTKSKPISVELEQLSGVTSATSLGSAKVMSTH